VDKFGPAEFNTVAMIMSYSGLAGLLTYFILVKYKKWTESHREKMIIAFGLYSIMVWITLPFISIETLYVLNIFTGIFDTMLQFCFLSMLIDNTPPIKKAMWYQIFALIFVAAGILFSSIGILIAGATSTVFLFVLIGILTFVNLPIILKINSKKFQEIMFPPQSQSNTNTELPVIESKIN
jgi:MFS family permease